MSQLSAPEHAHIAVHPSPLLLHSLTPLAVRRRAGRKAMPLTVSILLHSALVLAVVLVPLLAHDAGPAQNVMNGFFPRPLEIAVPPPPPPPRPAGLHRIPRPPARNSAPAQGAVAPVEIPPEITPDFIDVGAEGIEGGVDGGVPDGVVGGVIVGGLPPAAPPPPARIVRISAYAAPRLIRKVAPIYPDLAATTRVSGLVSVEAQVDTNGRVTMVTVLSGHPLLQESAVEAVRQWRYQPLLLNGEPTAFVLNVSVTFTLDLR